MTKTFRVSAEKFILMRRITASMAFASTCACLLLLLCGFFPFFDRNINVSTAINNCFELVNIGSRSFWYCAACVGFSIAYFWVAIKTVITIFSSLKLMKRWLFSAFDNEITRSATKVIVFTASMVLWRFLTLYAVSYSLSGFRASKGAVLTIVTLLLVHVLVNVSLNLLYKGEIFSGVIGAANNTLLLSLIPLFVFLGTNVQIIDAITSFVNFSSASSVQALGTIPLQILVNQVVVPTLYFSLLLSVIRLYNRMSNGNFDYNATPRSMLIRNLILFAVILFVLGLVNKYTVIADYLTIAHKNIVFALIALMVYVICKNTVMLPEDTPFVTPPEEAPSADAPAQTSEGQAEQEQPTV